MDSHNVTALSSLIGEVRVSNAIVVLGAGASFESGMPLAGQLAPLLWNALDDVPNVRRDIATAIGIPDSPGKLLVADDPKKLQTAFQHIASAPEARRRFQQLFARLNLDRRSVFSLAYDALARLVHAGLVELVVSLNWDTLLQAAYSVRYGVPINANKNCLVKPHGDADYPDADWTLPYAGGSLPNELVARVQRFVQDRPRVLVIVGYSEQDEAVVRQLVNPLEQRWRVVRVGPSVSGADNVAASAGHVLSQLAENLCVDLEERGWSYVTFANQRSIAAAISGEGLDQRDVNCCPRLAECVEASRRLALLHYVVISGLPGCGKSITAYQVADDFRRSGWAILRYEHATDSKDVALNAAKTCNHKRLLLVDDGQTVSERCRRAFIELAGPNVRVIIAQTDRDAGEPTAIHIANIAAVGALRDSYLQRRDEVLEVVSQLDDWVGERYLDTSIERRIEIAATADTPWQFNFILRGEWRRARRHIAVLHGLDRADLLLLAIAAQQIAQLDRHVAEESIPTFASRLGRDLEWAESALAQLRQSKALLPSKQIRCPHLRYADVVLEVWFSSRKDEDFELAAGLMNDTLCNPATPILGLAWLLNRLRFAEAFRESANRALLGGRRWDGLLARCLTAVEPVARRDSIHAIAALADWTADGGAKIAGQSAVLGRWLEDVDSLYAGSFGNLINSLWNIDGCGDQSPSARPILDAADPVRVAERFATATTSQGYGWGRFLANVHLAADEEWCTNFWSGVDHDLVLQLANQFQDTELADLAQFVNGIAHFDHELAYSVLERALPAIKCRLQVAPLDACEELDDASSVLGHFFFRPWKPNQRQRALAKSIVNCVPIDRLAADMSKSRQRDWERYAKLIIAWVYPVDRRVYRQLIRKIDFKQLTIMTRGQWGTPPRELRLLISVLAGGKNCEPARAWIAEHAGELKVIDPITASIAPEVAVSLVKRGGRVNLAGHNSRDWRLQARALAAIADIDMDVATTVALQNEPHLVSCIGKLEQIDCGDKLELYLRVLEKLDPALPVQTLRQVDVVKAKKSWIAQLKSRKMKSAHTVAHLVHVALTCSGPPAELAQTILKKLPKRLRKNIS